jgi:ribosomal protein L29
MAKQKTLINHSLEDLHKLVADKREELRALRFNVAGSKNRNVKLARTLRRDVARALTEQNSRKDTGSQVK